MFHKMEATVFFEFREELKRNWKHYFLRGLGFRKLDSIEHTPFFSFSSLARRRIDVRTTRTPFLG